MNYFISIDIGTTFLKGIIFSKNQQSQFTICCPIESLEIYQSDTQNIPSSIASALATCIQNLCNTILLQQEDTIDICISGNSPTLVFLDYQKEVIYCCSWYHSNYTELPNEQSYYLPYVTYIREHYKAIFYRTCHILPLAEYASFLLCNVLATFAPHTQFAPYLWNEKSITKHGFSPQLFPAIKLSGSLLGKATSAFATSVFGSVLSILFEKTKNPTTALHAFLNQQSRVFCGGIDYLSAIIGSVNINPGDICIRGGTSTVMNICLTQEKTAASMVETSPNRSMFSEFHLLHPLADKINKGIAIPAFIELHQMSNNALMLLQENTHLLPLFWKFFSHAQEQCNNMNIMSIQYSLTKKTLLQKINMTIQKIEQTYHTTLHDYFAHSNANMKKSISTLCYFLYVIKKVYIQLTSNSKYNSKKISLSGNFYSSDIFISLLATLFNKNITIYDIPYSELVGNILFTEAQHRLKETKENAQEQLYVLESCTKEFIQISHIISPTQIV